MLAENVKAVKRDSNPYRGAKHFKHLRAVVQSELPSAFASVGMLFHIGEQTLDRQATHGVTLATKHFAPLNPGRASVDRIEIVRRKWLASFASAIALLPAASCMPLSRTAILR